MQDLADIYIEPVVPPILTPVLSILKRDAPVANAAQSQLVDEMNVSPATGHIYRLQFKNTGNGPTTSPVTIADTLPAGVTCKQFRYKKRDASRSAYTPCNSATNFSYQITDGPLPANMPVPSEIEIVTQIDANISAGRIENI